MILARCGQATPTEAPPVATEAPPPVATDPPLPPFEGTALVAPDCEYGGKFKSITAVDRYTVEFALCDPFPAFLETLAFSVFSIYPNEWIEAKTPRQQEDTDQWYFVQACSVHGLLCSIRQSSITW